MTDIFVSYSRKDSATARKLIEAFKSIDLKPWVDWEDIPPAVDWLDQILQGIERSDAFIFLVSPDSAISEVCKVEIAHAVKNSKRIIPILVRDVDTKTVVETIRGLNWIYMREADSFDEAIEKIKVGINLDIEWVTEHRRLQVLALEWERRKDPSLLLRGGDLRNARSMILAALKKEPTLTPLQQAFVEYSNQDERRKITLWISVAVAVIMMIILSITAVYQARRASENAELAQANERIAQENAAIAIQNERIARDLQKVAEDSENIAEAQRSAARAQIYQSRTGGLYTSTLLAIDSIQRNPTSEAEEILRKNISLLPIPISQNKQEDVISALEINPLGDSYLTGSLDGTTCVWTLQTGENIFCLTHSSSVLAAVYGPDGKTIVVGTQAGELLFINAENGEVQNTYNYGVPIWNLSISPDGKFLAVARDDEKISVFNFAQQSFNYDLFTFGKVYVLAFSPDSQWIASGTSAGVTTLWNVGDGRIISGSNHQGEVYTLAFSPDSRFIVSGGADSVAYLTVVATGNQLLRIVNEDWVEDITFSPDGSWFATVSDDGRIRVWDTRTGREKIRMLQDSFMSDVEVSPNGQFIATTGYDKTIRIWSAATGAEIFQIPINGFGYVITFNNDGNYLISGDQSGNINTWDISSLSSAVNYIQFNQQTQQIQFSNSDEYLVASTEASVWLLNYKQLSSLTLTSRDIPSIELNALPISLSNSPDSSWLAISTANGEVILYNVAKKAKSSVSTTQTTKQVLFYDSNTLIIGDSDGMVQALNVSNNELTTLIEGGSKVNSLTIHRNQLAVGLLDKIILFDLTTNSMIAELQAPGDHAFMSFNADASIFAVGNSTGQIYIWKLRGNQYQLENTIPTEEIFSMTFNPQGDKLFIGYLSNLIILDPNTGKEISRILHKDAVTSISFSADGNTLATASLKAVQFWNVQNIQLIPSETLEPTACSRLTQNFDTAQWESFFGEEPFRKLCDSLP